MLREELLQSKNDEIAQCLWSRKRKLSELYFATTGFSGATDGSAQAVVQYRQKEEAFLDANDITKGRCYDEATLPIPIDFTTSHNVQAPSSLNESLVAEPSASVPDDKHIWIPDTLQGSLQNVSVISPPTQHEMSISEGLQNASALPASSVGVQPTVNSVPSATGPGQPTDELQEQASLPSSRPGSQNPAGSALKLPSQGQQKPKKHAPIIPGEIMASTTDQLHLSPAFCCLPFSATPTTTRKSTTSPTKLALDASNEINSPQTVAFSPGIVKSSATNDELSTPDQQLKRKADQPTQDSYLKALQQIDHRETLLHEIPPSSAEVSVSVNNDTRASDEPSQLPPDSITNTSQFPDKSTSGISALPSLNSKTEAALVMPRKPSITPEQPSERMTTRVSSGAIRQKSVSEILGQTPRTHSPSESSISQVTDALGSHLRLKDGKEKEKNKLSTVVFPKQRPIGKSVYTDLIRRNDHLMSLNEENDYLYTLFQAKAHLPPRGLPLSALLSNAHKTLSTKNYFVEYQEQMSCRILKRIYQLQHANRWPLRQFQRTEEPTRQPTHWDIFLNHMKWMRTDFREERKWKIAAAKSCAEWCAEYVAADPVRRATLRVKAKAPPRRNSTRKATGHEKSEDVRMDDASSVSHHIPDLVSSVDDDSTSDELNDEQPDINDGIPANIFSLDSDQFTFFTQKTPAADKILDELPLYAPVDVSPVTKQPMFKEFPDRAWRGDLLPVSKFAERKIMSARGEPPRKRSRYDYYDGDDENNNEFVELPADQVNVALFQPQNRPIRDRAHPAQSFRPPTESPMPSPSFYQVRHSSQWTCAEDDELRRLAKEYSYNWPLISSSLSPSSKYAPVADRRTPWECFERWVDLEGLPGDMGKTPYFKIYNNRIDTAQRNVFAAQQQAIHQHQQQGIPVSQSLLRRRTTKPVRVDPKRASRHLAMIDVMRKLVKKRETTLQKQQHNNHISSQRKINEMNQPRPPMSTPAEFSRLKHEREVKLREHYQQVYAAQRVAVVQRMALAQQQQQQQQQQGQYSQQPHSQVPSSQSAVNGFSRNGSGSSANGIQGMRAPITAGVPSNIPSNGTIGQVRPHPTIQALPNGAQIGTQIVPGTMTMKMVPQCGLTQTINGRPSLPAQASVMREASRLQEQQRHTQQQQFQDQQAFISRNSQSLQNTTLSSAAGNAHNSSVMTAFQTSGVNNPFFHATQLTPGLSSASPRMNHPGPSNGNPLQNSQAQGLSPLMRVAQPNQGNRPGAVGPMNDIVMQQNRNTVQQSHRNSNGNGQGMPSQPPGKSPRPQPPHAQTAPS